MVALRYASFSVVLCSLSIAALVVLPCVAAAVAGLYGLGRFL